MKKKYHRWNGVHYVLCVWMGLVLIGVASKVWAEVKTSETIVTPPESFIETASYIIFKDGSTICVKNGKTGAIDYSGTDATTVIQSALNALTNGGIIFIRRGSTPYEINKPLGVPSNVIVEGDFAVLAADWAGDYSPTNLGLPASFPPIVYNKNWGDGYGLDKNITIKNLILQGNPGQVEAEPGGAIPIRLRGVDNVILENLTFDNETLATGTGHAQMAQAAICLTRQNRNVLMNNITILGGWAGVYLSDPHIALPGELPTEANGANLRVEITNFVIKLSGGSNPFTPQYCESVNISNGSIYNKADLTFDLARANGLNINNITINDTSGTGEVSCFGLGFPEATDACRDVNISNIVINNAGKFIGFSNGVSKVSINNVILRGVNTGVLDMTNVVPKDVIKISNCDFSCITDPDRMFTNYARGNLRCINVVGLNGVYPEREGGYIYKTIGDAVSDIPATGGRVYVPPGTFNENIVIAQSKTEIVGSGDSTIINGGTSGAAITINGKTDVVIRDLQVKTSAKGESASNGINISNGANNFKLINLHVSQCNQHGITITGTNIANGLIQNCELESIANRGIHVDMNAGNELTHLRIMGNRFKKIGIAIYADDVTGGVMEGNMIDDCSDKGIFVNSGSSGIVVGNNRINSTAGIGICCSGDNCTITGNIVSAPTGTNIDGIRLDTASNDCAVVGNYARGIGGGLPINDLGANNVVANNNVGFPR